MFLNSEPPSTSGGSPAIPSHLNLNLTSSNPATSSNSSSATMRLCYNGATTLLAACPTAFVDLDSIREEPGTPFSMRSSCREDSVFFRESSSEDVSSANPSTNSATTSSPFKFMESIQRKRKSMFRRNQSSSSLISNEKRRTCRRPSLPSIPPTIDEMSSSVGHARSRRPSLHNDWTNEHHLMNGRGGAGGGGGLMGLGDNRIHHIDIEPQVNYFIAVFKDLDDRRDDTVEHIRFDDNQRIFEVFEPYLRVRGLTINDVEFFIDKSSTPIPENSGAHFLAGRKINVRGALVTLLMATVMKKKLLLMEEEEEEKGRKLNEQQRVSRNQKSKLKQFKNFRGFCKDVVASNHSTQKHFFVTKSVVDSIIYTLDTHINSQNSKISSTEKAIIFLEFVTGGESYSRLSRRLGISKGSISAIVSFVSTTINMSYKNIKLPEKAEEWRFVEETFARRGLLRCLGALDGKHVRIKSPRMSGSLFYNYKSFFSFVLLILVDGDGRILFMDVGTPGSTNDATIYNKSTLKRILESETSLPPPQYLDSRTVMSPFIIGDGIFPLSFHLMKPFERSRLTAEELVFNKCLSNSRVRVEHVFGILTTKFRILQRALECKYSTAVNIVSSLCRLHNLSLGPEKTKNLLKMKEIDCVPYANPKEQREYLKCYLNST